jgi:arsenate reductase
MARRILFLCTGNSARSQMAEALLRHLGGDRFEVYSAGTKPKAEIFPPVVEAMREIGLDMSGQKPKGVEAFLGRVHFDKVVIVCDGAERNCPSIFGASQRLFWPFDDPAAATGSDEEVLAECRRIRDEIGDRITDWLKDQPRDS